jgi:RNA polymerase sigma-70 factor (ECF subfamily)
VRSQLGTLSPELAAVVELAYFDGLSSSEIAGRLQIPIGTVKSRMARALESMRQGLLGPPGGVRT